LPGEPLSKDVQIKIGAMKVSTPCLHKRKAFKKASDEKRAAMEAAFNEQRRRAILYIFGESD
jgi:hypothetical protein